MTWGERVWEVLQWLAMVGVTTAFVLAVAWHDPRLDITTAAPTTTVAGQPAPAPAPPTLPTVPPTSPTTPLCHPEMSNAGEVSAAIRAHFPALWQEWACETAWAESDFHMEKVGPYGEIGAFQIHEKVWQNVARDKGFDIRTLDGNTAMAALILAEQGPDAWTCSGGVCRGH